MPSFEEEYFDLLKAIETAIVGVWPSQPDAQDRHVDKALQNLTRTYQAALNAKPAPTLKQKPIEAAFYSAVQASLDAHTRPNPLQPADRVYTVEDAVACLKRIRRSVGQMMKPTNGSGTAYLTFVRDYHSNDTPRTLR
jgi:type II secretory pathway component HofQ